MHYSKVTHISMRVVLLECATLGQVSEPCEPLWCCCLSCSTEEVTHWTLTELHLLCWSPHHMSSPACVNWMH